jgi:hypothetical protein
VPSASLAGSRALRYSLGGVNVVACERNVDRQQWYLDTVVRHAMMGIVEAPAGFSEEHEFFAHYDALGRSGAYIWARDREPLTAQVVLRLLGDLLEACR